MRPGDERDMNGGVFDEDVDMRSQLTALGPPVDPAAAHIGWGVGRSPVTTGGDTG